jgi:serine O-acetyltransferase
VIGPGLVTEHGFATTLTARTVGRDCRVTQQVTVGHTGRGQPVIGDRVSIGAGAVVVGPVTVGMTPAPAPTPPSSGTCHPAR